MHFAMNCSPERNCSPRPPAASPRRVDLNRIAVFVRVVEAGSFTAAAESLGLPKSSVSRAVSQLEAELGVRLLQRTTRKLALTEAGREYFGRTRQAMLELEEANTVVVDHGTELRGPIRVSVPGDLGEGTLARLVAGFVREHPEVRIELVVTPRRVDLVAEGFDLAVRAGPLEDSTLVVRRVGTTALGLFASPDYLRRRGVPDSLASLASHEAVLLRGQRGVGTWALQGPQGDRSVTVRGSISADDLSFVRSVVEAGGGIGLLPLLLCAVSSPTPRVALVHVLPEYRVLGGEVSIVSPPKEYEPSRVRLLREHLARGLAELPWSAGSDVRGASPPRARAAAKSKPEAARTSAARRR